MEIKKPEHLKTRERRLYEAGLKAAEQENYKYAVEMFRDLLKTEPGVLEVRQKLRETALKRNGGGVNPMKQALAPIVTLPNLILSHLQAKKGKFNEALDNGEAAMAFDPTSIVSAFIAGRAADAAGAPVITMMTLETVLEFNKGKVFLMDWLARTYATLGKSEEAIAMRRKILRIDNANAKYKQDLAQAEAEAAVDDRDPEGIMHADGGGGSAGTGSKQKDNAADKEAIERRIAIQEKAAQNKNTPEAWKTVGDLYAASGDYESALNNYYCALELSPAGDSALEYAITKALAAQYDLSISQWQDYMSDPSVVEEEKAKARSEIQRLTDEKGDTLIDRAKERLQRHPHDASERFELGKLQMSSGRYDDAVSNFEQTKSSPQFKEVSLIFLGKTYLARKNFDKAIELLNNAINLLPRFNKTKKLAYYTLAKAHEAKNDQESAIENYSVIYAVDPKYKDVATIVHAIYKKQVLEDTY